MNRCNFLATLSVTAVAARLPATPHRCRVTVQKPGGAWCYLPDGYVELKTGDRFRCMDPTNGALILEATVIEDGEATINERGYHVGKVEYQL